MDKNIIKLAKGLTNLTGLAVSPEHIHLSSRRYYYIPEASPNHPLFLHHYRGPFFVDIPKEDYDKLVKGDMSPEEYIENANWCFGYYWGGGSMISGGYFMPMDIHDKERIHRYMKILACTGCARVSGYRPSEERCSSCELDNCPFSHFKKSSEELFLPDDRLKLFEILSVVIANKFGYSIKGLTSSERLASDEIVLYPNFSEETFQLVISDKLAFDLLAHPRSKDFDWKEFALALKVYLGKNSSTEKFHVEKVEDFKRIMQKLNIFQAKTSSVEPLKPLDTTHNSFLKKCFGKR